MKDYVVRATAAKGQVRAFAAKTTEIASQAQKIHGLLPVAAAALGRVMTAGIIMAIDMKGSKNSLSIIVKGSGPLGSVVTVAAPSGRIKGYVDNPYVELPLNQNDKLDVSGAVGPDGKLTVVKDLGLKEPYVGQVALVSGEIGDDIANYYWESEQQPSVVALGTLVNQDLTVKAAGGYIIQPMPGVDDAILDQIENKLLEIPPISTMIDQGMSPEEILVMILGDLDVKMNASIDTWFECDCSRERLKGVVLSIGRDEIEDILEDDGQAELVCHYCSKKYNFDRKDLEELLKNL